MKTDNRRPDYEEKMKRTPEQWWKEWEKVKAHSEWLHPSELESFSEFFLGSLLMTHPSPSFLNANAAHVAHLILNK